MRRSLVTAVSLPALLALAACNSSSVLEPSAIAPKPEASAQPAPAANAAASPRSAAATAALGRTRLQIAPIVGASVEAAGQLAERMSLRARERAIVLAGSSDQAATHVLKGYFSALTEGKDTTVIYVWDIYDPSGNRLHRINGQMKAPSVPGAEGWAAVTPATMQAIADATIDQFTGWLAGNAG